MHSDGSGHSSSSSSSSSSSGGSQCVWRTDAGWEMAQNYLMLQLEGLEKQPCIAETFIYAYVL